MARARAIPVGIELPSARRMAEFLEAARRSRDLHGRWVSPPGNAREYRTYLRKTKGPSHAGFLVVTPDEELAGVVNLNEIVRGAFQSAYLGYYAFVPHQRHGYMRAGLGRVITRAFREFRLHRLEANVQPENTESRRLVKRMGFRREGVSPRYLKIAGRWRDHERWAITVEDWRGGRA